MGSEHLELKLWSYSMLVPLSHSTGPIFTDYVVLRHTFSIWYLYLFSETSWTSIILPHFHLWKEEIQKVSIECHNTRAGMWQMHAQNHIFGSYFQCFLHSTTVMCWSGFPKLFRHLNPKVLTNWSVVDGLRVEMASEDGAFGKWVDWISCWSGAVRLNHDLIPVSLTPGSSWDPPSITFYYPLCELGEDLTVSLWRGTFKTVSQTKYSSF